MTDRAANALLNMLSSFGGTSVNDFIDLLLNSRAKGCLDACWQPQAETLTCSWLSRQNPGQRPPDDAEWRTWLFLGGRGAGKTRAGAAWLHSRAVEDARLALVGATLNDVREVMIEGPSGLRAIAAPTERPTYRSSRRRLEWPNGAVAQVFSAEEPERLRGPQFDAAWADEFCAWPCAGDPLAQLRLGLRRGSDPRLVITTTPKPTAALRRLMVEPGVVVTRAPTAQNAANLSPDFLASLMELYGDTRLAAQELDGQVLDGVEGALWRAEDFAARRVDPPQRWDRLIVAVDPPAGVGRDACGIVVAARIGARAVVLEDASVHGRSPSGWARAVAQAAARWNADQVVAEANQGGEMVRTVLEQAGCACPVRLVHATLAKRSRAEPVAALYEQGRVDHAGHFAALEEEMMGMGSEAMTKSPDRADALVWALHVLILEPRAAPRVRGL